MVITESDLRQLWRDGKNSLPPFPSGTIFTPSAQDFLNNHQREIQFETPGPSPAAAVSPSSSVDAPAEDQRPAWDHPGAFPVVLSGPVPVCVECGQPVGRKPEHMTQLDAAHFAPKTHPRIQLRGRLDSLHALGMLVAAQARDNRLHQLSAYLDTLCAYMREIQSAEYNARPVSPLEVAGKSAEEIHAISHNPDQVLGIAHLVPGAQDATILHWLNFLRTSAREVEVAVLEAYPPPSREDLVQAANRLSSAVYYLELLFRSGVVSWNAVS
jgi:ethanolamine utilization cobalamin adenosyltransferase